MFSGPREGGQQSMIVNSTARTPIITSPAAVADGRGEISCQGVPAPFQTILFPFELF